MQPLVNCGHHLRALLQHCNGSPNRSLLIAVAYLKVRNRSKALARLYAEPHQLKQSLICALVRKHHQRITYRAPRRIYVSELARRKRLVVVAYTKTTSLKTCWQISQGPRINQLTQSCGGRPAQAANHVN